MSAELIATISAVRVLAMMPGAHYAPQHTACPMCKTELFVMNGLHVPEYECTETEHAHHPGTHQLHESDVVFVGVPQEVLHDIIARVVAHYIEFPECWEILVKEYRLAMEKENGNG